MNITGIKVRGLFNQFDYDIDIGTDGPITIIYGFNGYGKTTILELIYNILYLNFDEVCYKQFKVFQLEFDDGDRLKISRKVEPTDSVTLITLGLELIRPGRKANKGPVEYSLTAEFGAEGNIPDIDRVSPETIDILGEIRARFVEDNLMPNLNVDVYFDLLLKYMGKNPENLKWLITRLRERRCKLIKAQRLLGVPSEDDEPGTPRPAVLDFRENLKEQIMRMTEEYNAVSQERDRSFPKRLYQLMDKKSKTNLPSKEEIDEKMKAGTSNK